jgi:3-hydroxyisobutyrate dehydrogenase
MQGASVAVLGAGGTMGLPMTRNLARAGMRVTAWNRSPGKLAPLTADGIAVADSPAAAAGDADFVVTMLSDADAVLATMGGEHGALAAMDAAATWLQMSTIGSRAPRPAPRWPRAGGCARSCSWTQWPTAPSTCPACASRRQR